MIVIAYNGSADSDRALEWASHEAVRRSSPLTIVSAVSSPSVLGDPSALAPMMSDDLLGAVRGVGEEGAQRARAVGVQDVEVIADARTVTQQLVELSEDADLVVVGTRGRGELASAVLGSVSYSVCAHAKCPVVVVRGDKGDGTALVPGEGHPVVVGVDGSEASDRALDFAAQVAGRAQAPLQVVSVWSVPVGDGFAAAEVGAVAEAASNQDLRRACESNAQETLDEAVRRAGEAAPGVRVDGVLVEGYPSIALVDQAKASDAALLVSGSRGHGGFVGLLLGSVSHRLLHDAPCPVAVVR